MPITEAQPRMSHLEAPRNYTLTQTKIIHQQSENTNHDYNFIPNSENESSFVSHVEPIPPVITTP